MMGRKQFRPKEFYRISLKDMVPKDNIYRKINSLIDLSFVYEMVRPLYGATGNPSIDPVVFFKLCLFGYLENITYDRELTRQASDRNSIRLFLGYDIDEELPWHSTISRTRDLIPYEMFEEIFNYIFERCVKAGLVKGDHQSLDSTLIKANASLESVKPILTVKSYYDKTRENNKDDPSKEEKNTSHNINQNKTSYKKKNDYFISTTDPDSRIFGKQGMPNNLYYSMDISADTRYGIITNCQASYADMHDSQKMIDIVDKTHERLERFSLKVNSIGCDLGYFDYENLRKMQEREIEAFMPIKRKINKEKELFRKSDFIYDAEKDTYICPNKKKLRPLCKGAKYHEYKGEAKVCKSCKLRSKCTNSVNGRTVRRFAEEECLENLEKRMKTPKARWAMRHRDTDTEGIFNQVKNYCGLWKINTRGLDKANKKFVLSAALINLKKLLKYGIKQIRRINEAKNKVSEILTDAILFLQRIVFRRFRLLYVRIAISELLCPTNS